MLDGKIWGIVEKVFGFYIVDLMVSDFNLMKVKGGGVLCYFILCLMLFIVGVDMFV